MFSGSINSNTLVERYHLKNSVCAKNSSPTMFCLLTNAILNIFHPCIGYNCKIAITEFVD